MKRPTHVRGTIAGFSGRKLAVDATELGGVKLELTGPQGAQFSVWLSNRNAGRLHDLLALALGIGLAIASGAGCGDDLAPPKPDAGVRMDACDPTIDRTCMPDLHDAGSKP